MNIIKRISNIWAWGGIEVPKRNIIDFDEKGIIGVKKNNQKVSFCEPIDFSEESKTLKDFIENRNG